MDDPSTFYTPIRMPRPWSAGASGPIEANRVVWYRKNLGRSTTQWDDQSGNARHLALTGTPTVNGDGSMGFDGVDDRGTNAALTLAQPLTIYLRVKMVVWAAGLVMMDADAFGNRQFAMGSSTPQVSMIGSLTIGPVTGMTVGAYASICLLFNGASSVLRVNGTETAGDIGTSSDSGICFGSNRSSGAFSNIDLMEAIGYSVAHNAGQRTSQIAYMDTL